MRKTGLLIVLALAGCDPGLPTPPPNTCGNGTIEDASDEACDDGNQEGGDGCSVVCSIEFGHHFEGAAPGFGGIEDVYLAEDLPVTIHATLNAGGAEDVFEFAAGGSGGGTSFFFEVVDPRGNCALTMTLEIETALAVDTFDITPGGGPCFPNGSFFLPDLTAGQLRFSTQTDAGEPYVLVLSPIDF